MDDPQARASAPTNSRSGRAATRTRSKRSRSHAGGSRRTSRPRKAASC